MAARKKKKVTKRKVTKKKVKKTKLKMKYIACPHCKKKVKIEDLEVIEDTKGMTGGEVLSRSISLR